MESMPCGRLVKAVVLSMICCIGTATQGALAPVDAYAALPPIRDARLSPDGNLLLMLVAIDGDYHVGLRDLRSGESRILLAADPERFRYRWCRFASNERVVCSIHSPVRMQAGDHGMFLRYRNDGRTIVTRLLAVDVDGSDVLQLVPPAVSRPGRDLVWNAQDQDTVISWLPDEPDQLLLQIAREDRLLPSVYRLDIRSNALQRVQSFRSGVARWYADDAGRVRFAGGLRGGTPFALRATDDGWEEVDIAALGGIDPPELLAFHGKGDSAFVLAHAGADTRGLHRVDLASGAVLETLFSDPRHDAAGLLLHPRSAAPLLVRHVDDRPRQRWLDVGLGERMEAVAAALPGAPSRVAVMAIDDTVTRFVLRAEGNGTVPAWYLFDDRAQHLMPLARDHAGIDAVVEASVLQYEARDGERIPAYLTRPPDAQGPLPTILLPHGGPWSRDEGRFDYWTQLLVSRGWQVLQPNFRGSAGFGDRFLRLGFGQWGGTMHDDLIDGLDHLVANGLADPQRVCIVGGSFGGYAALMAALRAPERFRCAAAFAPVTDLDMLENEWIGQGQGRLAAERLPSGAARAAASPLARAGELRTPLLLVHGDADRSVHVAHSRELARALDDSRLEVRYIEQPGGDHHLSSGDDRLQFLAALEAFLVKHLSPR